MAHIKIKSQCTVIKKKKLSWSSYNAFASGAVGFRFKSRTGQNEYVTNCLPSLRHFFEKSWAALKHNTAEESCKRAN